MACRSIVSPITGQEVTSKLWNDIYDNVLSESEADKIYESTFTPEFLKSFGDWINMSNLLNKVGEHLGEVKGIYKSMLSNKDNREQLLFELAQQLNSSEDEKNTTIRAVGQNIADIIVQLFPNSKVGDEFIPLSSKLNDIGEPLIEYLNLGETNADESFDPQVKARLKILGALDEPKTEKLFDRFFKSNKEKFYQELIPSAGKVQVELLKDYIQKNNPTSLDDLKIGLASELSYTTKIETAQDSIKTQRGGAADGVDQFEYEGKLYMNIFGGWWHDGQRIPYDEIQELIKKSNEFSSNPTQYYSNLTVPGGTNYTENEISTPQIIPSIKGHAQFSTDNGIGWFRSDDKAEGGTTLDTEQILFEGTEQEMATGNIVPITYGGTSTKTRRVLELQSDLFQKSRDADTLVNSYKLPPIEHQIVDSFEEANELESQGWIDTGNRSEEGFPIYEKPRDEYVMQQELDKLSSGNTFLQLLNKEGNWVKFFVKAIAQDSIRKGYEKVLFPSGDTASKVEGHETIEGFIAQQRNQIKSIEADLVRIREEEKEGIVITDGGKYTRKNGNYYYAPFLQFDGDHETEEFEYDNKFYSSSYDEETGDIKYIYLKDYDQHKDREFDEDAPKKEFVKITKAEYNDIKAGIFNKNNKITAEEYELAYKELVSEKQHGIDIHETEIERVEREGFSALKPIWNFYENTVSNIVRKAYGSRVSKTTDEFGNTWNELTLDDSDYGEILFDESFSRSKTKSSKKKEEFKELPFKHNVARMNGSVLVLQPRQHEMATYKDSVSGKLVNLVPQGKLNFESFVAASGFTKKEFIERYITKDQMSQEYMQTFLNGQRELYGYRLDPVTGDKNKLPNISDPVFARFYDNRQKTLEILKETLRTETDEAKRKEIRKKITKLYDQSSMIEEASNQSVRGVLDMLSGDLDTVENVLNNNPDWRALNYAISLLSNYSKMLNEEFKDIVDELDADTKIDIFTYLNRSTKLTEQIQNNLLVIGNKEVKRTTGKDVVDINGVLVKGADTDTISTFLKDSTENINPIVQTLTKIIKTALVKINARYNKFKIAHKDIVSKLVAFQKRAGLAKDKFYDYMVQYDNTGDRTGNIISEFSYDYRMARINSVKEGTSGELLFWANNHTFKVNKDLWTARKAELIQYYKDTYSDHALVNEVDELYGVTFEMKLNRLAAKYAEKYNPNTILTILERAKKNPTALTESDIFKFGDFKKRGGFTTTYVNNEKVNIMEYQALDKWKDSKWLAIQNMSKDDPRRVFYDHFTDNLRKGRISMRMEDIDKSWNYIPEKTKQLPIGSKLRQWTTDNLSQIISSNIHGIDPITGEISKAIPLYMLRGDVSNTNKSYDLGDVLGDFAKEYMNYEEKKKIEDDANLLLYMLKKQEVYRTNADGSPVIVNGKEQTKEGVSNNYKMGKYRLDAQLYDERQDKELVTNIKMRDEATKRELKSIKRDMDDLNLNQLELEDAFGYFNTGSTYTGTNEKIKKYIDLLHKRSMSTNTNVKYITGNKVANTFMYYTSLKFLGLNLFAGIGEMLQGTLSLFTESAAGRWFNDKEALKAMGIMMGLRTPGKRSDVNQKVQGLSRYFDILGKVFQESNQDNLVSKVGFSLYEGTNYIVNHSFMIATLMHEKVKDREGKKWSLWDALKVSETGDISWTKDIDIPLVDQEGAPTDYLTGIIFKVKEVIKNNRDRQTSDDPILLEKSMVGRILGQFKKNWLFRAFYNRYGEHREADQFTGKDFKGFYRTVAEMFAPVKSINDITGEESITAGGIAQGVGKGISKVLRATAIARVLGLGIKEGELSELDESNLYKFMRELSLIITISATMLVISSAGGDDDDDKSWFRTWVMNQLVRLQRDLLTYMSPSSLASIVKNPAPVLSTVTDLVNIPYVLFQSTVLMDPYTHDSKEQLRILKAIDRNIPFVTQVDRLANKLERKINYNY